MREQQLNEYLFDSQHAAAAADSAVMMMSDAGGHHSSMSPGAELPHDEDSASSCKTPMRGIVKAYLPKKMTTVVSPLLSLLLAVSVHHRHHKQTDYGGLKSKN